MQTTQLKPRSFVPLKEARDHLPCTVEELSRTNGASKRAASRALQYLVHKGQADYDKATRVYS